MQECTRRCSEDRSAHSEVGAGQVAVESEVRSVRLFKFDIHWRRAS